MSPLRSTIPSLLSGALLAAGCLSEPDQPALGQHADEIAGVEGTFEFALDAPWRMNPYVFKALVSYDPVPIQVSIHDADRSGDERGAPNSMVPFENRSIGSGPTRVGNVCELVIYEGQSQTHVDLAGFAEVERTIGPWTFPSTAAGPTRQACAATTLTNCAALAYAGDTSEWHGLVMYRPRGQWPGANVGLRLELRLTRSASIPCTATDPTQLYRLTNYVTVHYGEAPLPRFSPEWVYGDLHYHAQGTDNEGESAFNYRGVTRAMQAIGLDFLFATEHASASEQLVDVDVAVSSNLDYLEARAQRGVLRDTDANRFAALRSIAAAANAASALRAAGINRTPQIFVGGELDAIPEQRDQRQVIDYGAGRQYAVGQLCGGWKGKLDFCTDACRPGVMRCCEVNWIDSHACDPAALFEPAPAANPPGSPPEATDFLLRDVQGLNDLLFGREHLVYLPNPDAPSFVGSMTGRFGGARRRLTVDRAEGGVSFPALLPEVAARGGSVFLAHHNNAPSGSPAPEGPPWTTHMLRQAWASPAVVGLELWNENGRRSSPVEKDVSSDPAIGVELGYTRASTVAGEDLQLVDVIHSALRMGSNGELVLRPYEVPSGRYHHATTWIEEMLTDGTATWDQWNLVGLDPRETGRLGWLTPGMPRRLFIAAGSDAHGDFNYRRNGYVGGTTSIEDTALGSPRNLAFVGPPATVVSRNAPLVHGPREVTAALRAGRFTATDGPAVRIVYDLNDNGLIDAGEPTMGDVVDLEGRRTVPILVEWISTAEFGGLRRIELTVGAWSPESDFDRSRLYTGGDGVGGPAPSTQPPYDVGTIRYRYDSRGYWHLDTNQVTPDPDPANANMLGRTFWGAPMYGVHRFVLDLDALHAANGGRLLRATRFFVRALAITNPKETGCGDPRSAPNGLGRCLSRYAYTNPIWIRDVTHTVPGDGGVVTRTAGQPSINAPAAVR